MHQTIIAPIIIIIEFLSHNTRTTLFYEWTANGRTDYYYYSDCDQIYSFYEFGI